MTPIPSVTRPARDCLTLNELERKLFGLLRECCVRLELDVTLRVAGGWVRDKLLGLEGHDCDIAIDRMMGQQFAERLRFFLEQHDIPSSAYGVIQANPERSKHLETATLTIFGHPIDFANLRSETYSDDSRIPIVQFGTPLQDAQRRDITINALFYNIHTEEVEDFCGTGFADLEEQIIRTPLPPRETLMDDPLRLLRVIRFATRFQFRTDAALERAIQDEEVDAAFRNKISRERVGTELDKILRDKHALEGLQMMHRLRVFNLVFDLPAGVDRTNYSLPEDATIGTILRVYRRLGWSSNRRLALLCAALLPHVGEMVDRPRRMPEPLVGCIVRDSLKFTNQDVADVTQLVAQVDRVVALVETNCQDARLLGRLVRSLGRHWLLGYELACIRHILLGGIDDETTVHRYEAATKRVAALGLQDAHSWRGLLSGRDLHELLGVAQGPQIGLLINELLDWQYEHPDGTRDEAVKHILHYSSTQNT
ncbi:Poly A polymerase, head domain-containing protein [Paramicrosporidium saccamoebae]|uniref:Poly A polymerase, head domain-containing protein n=1 Tax=Paramicrosporidium saccamoebae TaxID=1246581 RepID=A0A2H9TMF6_9FUNG|nr:Poly A polymerase, head domain-containing protein [Paramicrosporidium saccamoebae]